MFRDIKPLTFFSAFESPLLGLWDEERQMLIKFREVEINMEPWSGR
ncbi:MAG: hypothetical protein WA816_06910 [Bacteroidales bacterium]